MLATAPLPDRARRRRLAWLLAAALLLAQGLGLWHRIAHAPHGDEWAAASPPAQPPFGHDADDSSQCRLYDQLTAADAAFAAAGETPPPSAPVTLAAPRSRPITAAPLWRLRARGPPAA